MNIPVSLTPEEQSRATRAIPMAGSARRPRRWTRLLAWLAVLLASAGLIGGLGYYKYTEINAAIAAAGAMPEPSEHVEAVQVRRGQWSQTAGAVGTVVALRKVELRSELAGTVVEVGFRSGDIVEEGQVLVRLDTRQEEAERAAAEASARLARTIFERRQALRSGQTVSEQAVDDAREELAVAEAHMHALQVGIEKKTIRAPFRGRVGLTDLQPGAYLDIADPIAMLQSVETDAFVDFALPQDVASAIRPGQTVTLSGQQFPGQQFPTLGRASPPASSPRTPRSTATAAPCASARWRAGSARRCARDRSSTSPRSPRPRARRCSYP